MVWGFIIFVFVILLAGAAYAWSRANECAGGQGYGGAIGEYLNKIPGAIAPPTDTTVTTVLPCTTALGTAPFEGFVNLTNNYAVACTGASAPAVVTAVTCPVALTPDG